MEKLVKWNHEGHIGMLDIMLINSRFISNALHSIHFSFVFTDEIDLQEVAQWHTSVTDVENSEKPQSDQAEEPILHSFDFFQLSIVFILIVRHLSCQISSLIFHSHLVLVLLVIQHKQQWEASVYQAINRKEWIWSNQRV